MAATKILNKKLKFPFKILKLALRTPSYLRSSKWILPFDEIL